MARLSPALVALESPAKARARARVLAQNPSILAARMNTILANEKIPHQIVRGRFKAQAEHSNRSNPWKSLAESTMRREISPPTTACTRWHSSGYRYL